MKALKFRSPGGISCLELDQIEDPGPPNAHEIRVRIHANSLNPHDRNVAIGALPVEDGRVMMSDGAGVVEAVGTGVKDFVEGDRVVSTFFPDWNEGAAPLATFARTPGDGLDGFAAETVVRPASWFTHMPRSWSFVEAATLPTAWLTAWRAIVVEGRTQVDHNVLVLGTGAVSIFALQFAKK